MPSKCAVRTCRNYCRKYKQQLTNGSYKRLSFHKFPRNMDKQNLWKKLCGRDSCFNIGRYTLICEEHFPEEVLHTQQCKFFNNNYNNSRCCCPIQNNAIPTLNLPQESMAWIEKNTPKDETHQKVDYRTLVKELMEAASSPEPEGAPEPVTCVLVNETYPEEEDLQLFSESEPESEVDLVEDEPSVFQLEDLCRVCALAGGDMVGVFSTDGLLSKVSLCLPVKMEEGDQLPANVCRSCLNRIEQSFELANMALTAEAILKGMLQQQKTFFEDNQKPEIQESPDEMSVEYFESNEELKIQESPNEMSVGYFESKEELKIQESPNEMSVEYFESNEELKIQESPNEMSVGYFESKEELKKHSNTPKTLFKPWKPFPCKQCERRFRKKFELADHVYYDHEGNEARHKCFLCDKVFKTKRGIKCHVANHSSERKFQCLQCEKKFGTKDKLKAHTFTHIQEKTVICEVCGASFKAKMYLNHHLRNVHTETWIYNCNICSASCKSESEVMKHFNEHGVHEKSAGIIASPFSKVYKYKCEICSTYHANKFNFCLHNKTFHETELENCDGKWECEYCLKTFKGKKFLKLHLSSHMLIKPFQCSYCDKSYCTNHNLIVHTRIHTNENPFSCNLCEKAFRAKHKLHIHIRQVHEKVKKFQCSYCPKKLFSRVHLTTHTRSHTNERPYMCDICSQQFKHLPQMKKHVKKHEMYEVLPRGRGPAKAKKSKKV